MNKLSILDDLTNKTKWSCSLDNCLDITQIWDEISGFTYIVNMLCENKYKNIYFCINNYGKKYANNILLKNNIPILNIKICDKNNNTINLTLGYQNLTWPFEIKKISFIELNNNIKKFENISDFSNLFKDINKLMIGCRDIYQRYN